MKRPAKDRVDYDSAGCEQCAVRKTVEIHQIMKKLLKRVVVVGLLALVAIAGCRVNPVTGKKELSLISEGQELQMGNGYHPDIVFMYDGEYLDPELKNYLGSIVNRLHKVSHRSEMPVDFTVLNTSVLNAFATPGHVYATRGFLSELTNEAQFAAVMGHELTHVAAGHSALRMSTQMITAVGLGLLQSSLGESDSTQAVLLGTQLSVTMFGLSYSRQQEHQADRVGTYYMALAGWDPNESITMQELLGSFHKGKASFLDKYLSTHPPTDERIADIRNVISEKNIPNSGLIQGDGIYAERWQRRLAGLHKVNGAFKHYDSGIEHYGKEEYQQAFDAAVKAAEMDPRQAPFYKLQGDALRGLGRLDKAGEAYQTALMKDPRFVPANIGLGEIALGKEKFDQAEKEFAVASHGYPGSVHAKYGLGVSQFRQGKYEQAIEPLVLVAQAVPSEPAVHFLLGTSYYQTNQWQPAYESYQKALETGLKDDKQAAAKQRVEELTKKLAPPPAESK